MARGFVSLTAGVDVASRRVLAHPVAITREAHHAVEVIKQAFACSGTPEIVNSDPGSPFTQAVRSRGGQLSMDGRGAWRDNVLVEHRLWRNVTYEHAYLKVDDGVSAARTDTAQSLHGYNTGRAHSRLDDVTPEQAYRDALPQLAEAA